MGRTLNFDKQTMDRMLEWTRSLGITYEEFIAIAVRDKLDECDGILRAERGVGWRQPG